MSTIKYEIIFFSNWHCGSGQAAGADVDMLVIKDCQGLPYVPGKTIKGLLRDAATVLSCPKAFVDRIFGVSGDKVNPQLGDAYFCNATFPKTESDYIVSEKLTPYLYQSFASTAIDDQGIGKNATLRKVETVVPCKLEGSILCVPEDAVSKFIELMKYIKRIGVGRNRGFGRCQLTIKGIEKEEEK